MRFLRPNCFFSSSTVEISGLFLADLSTRRTEPGALDDLLELKPSWEVEVWLTSNGWKISCAAVQFALWAPLPLLSCCSWQLLLLLRLLLLDLCCYSLMVCTTCPVALFVVFTVALILFGDKVLLFSSLVFVRSGSALCIGIRLAGSEGFFDSL